MKTVHGPEAHVTKKQRGDVPPRPQPPRGSGENESSHKLSGRSLEGMTEANSTTRGADDCLLVKSIKTENSMVSPDGRLGRFGVHPAFPYTNEFMTNLTLFYVLESNIEMLP